MLLEPFFRRPLEREQLENELEVLHWRDSEFEAKSLWIPRKAMPNQVMAALEQRHGKFNGTAYVYYLSKSGTVTKYSSLRDSVAAMSLINEIRSFCSHFNVNGPLSHLKFLHELGAHLSSYGYRPHREYPSNFASLRRRDNTSHLKRGFIDLLLDKNNLTVGIEFDNGNRLRFRNIEKLLQSHLTISVGIVRTSSSFSENISRTKRVMAEQKLFPEFWLLSIQEGKCERVELS
jgi:hypothetical protein